MKIKPNLLIKKPIKLAEALTKLVESLKFNKEISNFSKPNLSTLHTEDALPSKLASQKKKNNVELCLTFDDIVKQLKKRKKVRAETHISENQPHSATKKAKVNSIKSVIFNSDEVLSPVVGSRRHTVKIDRELQPIIESEENGITMSKHKAISEFNAFENDRKETTENLLLKNFSREVDKKNTISPMYPKITKKKTLYQHVSSSNKESNDYEEDGKIQLFKKSLSLDASVGDEMRPNRNFDNFLLDMKDFRGEMDSF